MRLDNRISIFKQGRNLHSSLGNPAQNEYNLTQPDIDFECTRVDNLIKALKDYKSRFTSNIKDN